MQLTQAYAQTPATQPSLAQMINLEARVPYLLPLKYKFECTTESLCRRYESFIAHFILSYSQIAKDDCQ